VELLRQSATFAWFWVGYDGMRRARYCEVQKYSPHRALVELDAQHSMLRGMMERCEALADELDAGRCGPLQLTREVERLRLAFEAHNRFEEELLRPVLFAGVDAATLEASVQKHVDEHRKMRMGLATSETTMLREVIDSMRAHLDAEERFLRSASSLRVAGARA
jgi:hypothetical protein